MPSKLVTARQRSALAVIKSIETNASLVGAALDALLQPIAPAGVVLQHKTQLEIYGALLSQATQTMIEKDEADIKEGLDDAEPIKRRDTEAATLYDKLVALRRAVTGVYGDTTARALGFSGEISRDPVVLSRFTRELIKTAPEVKTPTPLIEGITIDLKASAASAGETSAKLDVALSDVAREVREGQQSLSEKNTAVARYDTTFAAVVSLLDGLYRLAGYPDLADKIRPSTRRPGQIEEEGAEGDVLPTPTNPPAA